MVYCREDILKQAKKLKQSLQDTDVVSFYQIAEAKINQNKKVTAKLSQMKSLQKQAVNLEHYQKYKAMRQIESEINRLQKEIDALPVVADFKQAQTEANHLLQSVISEINQQINTKMEELQ